MSTLRSYFRIDDREFEKFYDIRVEGKDLHNNYYFPNSNGIGFKDVEFVGIGKENLRKSQRFLVKTQTTVEYHSLIHEIGLNRGSILEVRASSHNFPRGSEKIISYPYFRFLEASLQLCL